MTATCVHSLLARSCFGVRECHWCEGEQKCAHITECCSLEQGRSCCTSDEEKRLEAFVATCLVIDTDCFRKFASSRDTYIHVCTYVCMCVHVCVHVCTCVCMGVHVCVQVHTTDDVVSLVGNEMDLACNMCIYM